MCKRLVVFLLAVIVLPYTANADKFTNVYERLLSRHVYEGEQNGIKTSLVNYAGWAQDHRHKRAMALLQRTNTAALKAGAAEMAFWINAYNLLTIDLIIKQQERESIKNLGGLFTSPWRHHEWAIDGIPYTLDHIEHEILRPMGDPRIHMAINCASLSCPDLQDSPYMAEILDDQLNRQTRDFLNNKTKGVRLTAAGFEVSNIFNWFEEDFGGGEQGVIQFISKHIKIPEETPERINDYIKYNWKLNGTWANERSPRRGFN